MIHNQLDYAPLVCSIDPLTAIGLAVAGIGAAGASGAFGGSSAPTAAPPPTAAPAAQSPIGQKPAATSNQPSFVGASAAPASGFGQKTLLGQ